MSDKILITGATGFLGQSLAHELTNESWVTAVYCLVRPGRIVPSAFSQHPKIRLVFADLARVNIPFSNGIVIHCAALRSESTALWETNVVASGGLAARSAARDCDFIYASSQAVYGSPRYLPAAESTPLAPDSDYGRSKAAGEQAVHEAYVGATGHAVALRLARLYGRSVLTRMEGALGAFLNAASMGRKATIHGTGSHQMDLLHIADACRAVLVACRQVRQWTGAWNVGAGSGISILQLARTIKTFYPDFSWEFDHSKSERSGIWLDTRRFRTAAGWEPRVSLAQGIGDALGRSPRA